MPGADVSLCTSRLRSNGKPPTSETIIYVVDDDEPMRNSLGLLFNTVGLKDRYLLIAIRVH
ncbi:MAG: hypothetical protein ABSA96_19410 [Candidatus Acidiferrales bacterium]